MMAKILSEAKVSYIKWDMNRSITECYSVALPADRQGEVFHRYILGVYDLYERLTSEFPAVLFESCSSGGGRFDPGIVYDAPVSYTHLDVYKRHILYRSGIESTCQKCRINPERTRFLTKNCSKVFLIVSFK